MCQSSIEVSTDWDNIRIPTALIGNTCSTLSTQDEPLIDECASKVILRIPPLVLPPLPCFKSQLERLHLSREALLKVEGVLSETISSIDCALQKSYSSHLPQMYAWAYPQINQSWSITNYAQALQKVLCGLRYNSVNRLWKSLLLHLNSREEAASLESLRPNDYQRSFRTGRPCVFSKEQTMVLRTLLAHDDRYSPEEKQLIATSLNLTREQVNRWFCNARARKKPYQKMKGNKSVYSILSSGESSPTFETHSQPPCLRPTTPSPQYQFMLSPLMSKSPPISTGLANYSPLKESLICSEQPHVSFFGGIMDFSLPSTHFSDNHIQNQAITSAVAVQ